MRHTLRGLLNVMTLMAILVVLVAGCQALTRNETMPAQNNASENRDASQNQDASQNGDASQNRDQDADLYEADDDHGDEDEDAHESEADHGHGDVLPHLDAVSLAEGERLRVVATTSIVADIVSRVGGNHIELIQLMPLGVDSHAFEPTPRDVTAMADAHVVFVNGAGLEPFLDSLVESAEGVPVVPVSAGIELLPFELEDHDDVDDDDDDHGHEGEGDPHVWFDPNQVLVWVHNIEEVLSDLDPRHADSYAANAEDLEAELEALDDWIRDQVASVPEERRLLVTDHALLTYFAARYGFEQIGAVIPAATTVAEPSAQELAALQDAIGQYSVPAIFVGHEVNSRVAEQIAADTGIELVFIYTESLSEENGPAATYLDFMRYNVSAIVEGLRE
jgi:ABC-type Zn uptake system ZnuABC Zn-binding protein ZnuA